MTDRKSYLNVVTILPPQRADGEDVALLTFQVKSGETIRLAMSCSIAKHFGMQLQLMDAANDQINRR